MNIFKIVKDNKPSLRQRSSLVEEKDFEETKKILLEMIEYLKLSQDEKFLESHKNIRSGVGLAAPQIGINKQFLAIYYEDENKKVHELGLINPKILSESTRKCYLAGGEGCLSVDEKHEGYVLRPYKITLKAYNVVTNKEEEKVYTGYDAVVLQHEIDHLKGILYYDHINKINPFKKEENSVEL